MIIEKKKKSCRSELIETPWRRRSWSSVSGMKQSFNGGRWQGVSPADGEAPSGGGEMNGGREREIEKSGSVWPGLAGQWIEDGSDNGGMAGGLSAAVASVSGGYWGWAVADWQNLRRVEVYAASFSLLCFVPWFLFNFGSSYRPKILMDKCWD